MISPNWTSKDVLSAASGLWQGQRRNSKVKEALQVVQEVLLPAFYNVMRLLIWHQLKKLG